MNKQELVDAIAKDSGLSASDARKALDSFTTVVAKQLKKGDEVTLTGFGKFSVTKRAARKGVNPATGSRSASRRPRRRSAVPAPC